MRPKTPPSLTSSGTEFRVLRNRQAFRNAAFGAKSQFPCITFRDLAGGSAWLDEASWTHLSIQRFGVPTPTWKLPRIRGNSAHVLGQFLILFPGERIEHPVADRGGLLLQVLVVIDGGAAQIRHR